MLKLPVRVDSFLAVFFVFLTLITGAPYARCDDRAYDEREAIRRTAEKLVAIDRAKQKAARLRYDAKHSSGNDSPMGALLCVGIIILIAWGYKASAQKKREEQENSQTVEAEKKALFAERFERATSLGFSIDNETKECPVCAEIIRLKATACRYCRKEFSDEEMEKVIGEKVLSWLTTNISTSSAYQNQNDGSRPDGGT